MLELVFACYHRHRVVCVLHCSVRWLQSVLVVRAAHRSTCDKGLSQQRVTEGCWAGVLGFRV